MDWIQSVQSYIRVIEEGSFNAAARKLNTTSSAISKRIQWLEDKNWRPVTQAYHSFNKSNRSWCPILRASQSAT